MLPSLNPFARLLSLLGLAVAVQGCAAADPAREFEWRAVVKVTSLAATGEEIARRATHSSGVAVRYLAAAGGQWHSLALRCSSDAACEKALQRLQDDRDYFSAVEREQKRRAHGLAPSAPFASSPA